MITRRAAFSGVPDVWVMPSGTSAAALDRDCLSESGNRALGRGAAHD
jgi:hypothetical protein